MALIRRVALTAAVALAGVSATAAPASADLSFTAIEFKNTGSAFVDYTDDASRPVPAAVPRTSR